MEANGRYKFPLISLESQVCELRAAIVRAAWGEVPPSARTPGAISAEVNARFLRRRVDDAYVGPPLPHAQGRRATGGNPMARECASQFAGWAYGYTGVRVSTRRIYALCMRRLRLRFRPLLSVRPWVFFFCGPLKFSAFGNTTTSQKTKNAPMGGAFFFCFPPNGGVFVRPVYKIIEYRNRPNKRIIELTVSFAKDYTTLPYRKCVNDPCPNLRNLHPEIRIRYFELRPNYSQSKIALGYQVCL